ncbi:MAG: SIS domain-containing protein [Firmicutes bacterium]|nr:SIS domain-containing protein [Bacillota bacterium]
MKKITSDLIDETLSRCPKLESLKHAVIKAVEAASRGGGKVLVCGNGGSSADGEHIVGELMKEFRCKRPVTDEFARAFAKLFPDDKALPGKLQGAISTINLSSHTSLTTAIANDIGAEYIYAQQVYGYCDKNDVLIAISTSGNALNVINAAKTAKAKGGIVIAMTGADGGKLKEYADVLLNVPETETYRIQELHLPLYHLLCACTELELWGCNAK